jgi:hypothetical protein
MTTVARQAITVLFGPQGPVTEKSLLEIRTILCENTQLSFLLEAISELPTIWPALVNAWPGLTKLAGDRRLKELSDYLHGDTDLAFPEALGNILLCPLTVISQIIEFWQLTHGNTEQPYPESNLQDVQGFCLGFLTAVSISCSKNEAQYELLVLKAIRLAVCLGALVDLNTISGSGESNCASTIAVRWKSNSHWQHLERTMERYSHVSTFDFYISTYPVIE